MRSRAASAEKRNVVGPGGFKKKQKKRKPKGEKRRDAGVLGCRGEEPAADHTEAAEAERAAGCADLLMTFPSHKKTDY